MLKLNAKRNSIYLASAAALSAVLTSSGCSNLGSNAAPCLSYSPQLVKRTVGMRGYGSVEITEEKYVCVARASSPTDIVGGD